MVIPAIASTPTQVRDGRNAAASINETEILRDAIAATRSLGALYCVGRRRPISELTPEQQEKVREAYRDTLWSSDYGVDMMGVCTSQALADKICKEHGPNWFWTKLPIDTVLGDEPVFGEWAHVFPGSDAREMYENMESAVLAVRVTEMRAFEAGMKAIESEVAKLQETIKQARRIAAPHP